MRGEMLWFNDVKDLGFILTEEGERLSVLGPASGDEPGLEATANDGEAESRARRAGEENAETREEAATAAGRPRRCESGRRNPRAVSQMTDNNPERKNYAEIERLENLLADLRERHSTARERPRRSARLGSRSPWPSARLARCSSTSAGSRPTPRAEWPRPISGVGG